MSAQQCMCSVAPHAEGLMRWCAGRTPGAQAAAWRAYIGWERSNPQRLDGAALAARVSLAYEQALMPLYHHPEVRSPQVRDPCHTHNSAEAFLAALRFAVSCTL